MGGFGGNFGSNFAGTAVTITSVDPLKTVTAELCVTTSVKNNLCVNESIKKDLCV